MKPALLVVDVQKEFFKSPTAAQSLNDAIEYINDAIALFRRKGMPVICIQHKDEESNLIPGTGMFDLPENLKVLASDTHIVKTYGNGFNKTPLAAILKKLDIDTVIIAGYSAEYCVLSTYRGALDLDLKPILLRNGLASRKPRNIQFVDNLSDVISYGALKALLD
jgi:nicotinamidase-related amidase